MPDLSKSQSPLLHRQHPRPSQSRRSLLKSQQPRTLSHLRNPLPSRRPSRRLPQRCQQRRLPRQSLLKRKLRQRSQKNHLWSKFKKPLGRRIQQLPVLVLNHLSVNPMSPLRQRPSRSPPTRALQVSTLLLQRPLPSTNLERLREPVDTRTPMIKVSFSPLPLAVFLLWRCNLEA